MKKCTIIGCTGVVDSSQNLSIIIGSLLIRAQTCTVCGRLYDVGGNALWDPYGFPLYDSKNGRSLTRRIQHMLLYRFATERDVIDAKKAEKPLRPEGSQFLGEVTSENDLQQLLKLRKPARLLILCFNPQTERWIKLQRAHSLLRASPRIA